ncbi:Os02g0492300 [Oryza sativa Japonica Group]|uniref:[RNA-polymerase]-subunit kinase n=1 Tax=Oryza sativa subsp. japonica TaxID=39947 RepID=A0A0P0VJ77_ORYSJ|nr:Os02g0492300 [Oryza sativa Japonica Group]
MACKRPTPDGDACSATAAVALSPCNKPRWLFMSIFNYKRMETLGAGTYIVVYRARDRRTGETVAVKWLADVERDCLAACRGHPYVVQLRDVAANPSNRDMFLVKEFVGARSLRDLIAGHARRRPFSEGETRALMRQLRAGVRTMHAAGIAHRDIKPRNILIGPGGALKICDFGMATTAAPPYEGFMVGTLHYNTPEQLAGKGQYNAQAVDMWALGEVLAGLLAFYDDERMMAEAALEHRWFMEEADSPTVLEGLAGLLHDRRFRVEAIVRRRQDRTPLHVMNRFLCYNVGSSVRVGHH